MRCPEYHVIPKFRKGKNPKKILRVAHAHLKALATRSHIRPGLRFNFLGFLTEARNAVAA